MYQHFKKGKIIATLGPAVESKEKIEELVRRGVNIFRLNFSHSTHADHKRRMEIIKKISKKHNLPIGILLDTKGPEIRVGKLKDGFIPFKVGEKVKIVTTKDIIGDKTSFSISHRTFHKDVMVGNRLLFDDGQLKMKVIKVQGETIIAQVLNEYVLISGKGMNCPGTPTSLDFISKKDKKDIEFGCREKVNYIAPSFVRRRKDVLELKELIKKFHGPSDIQIISKIECQEGVDHFDEILDESDGIMVARGDLGVEIPYESVPRYQRIFTKKCLNVGKPVIIATQMLKTMTKDPYPTRAEITDIYWAMRLGADATMLSGETAAGKWPKESVSVMYRTAKRSENDINFEKVNNFQIKSLKERSNKYVDLAERITNRMRNDTYHSVVIIVENVDDELVRALSVARPRFGIIPLVTNLRKAENMTLLWGVQPYVVKKISDYYDIDKIKEVVASRNHRDGDKVLYVITDQYEGYTVRTIAF